MAIQQNVGSTRQSAPAFKKARGRRLRPRKGSRCGHVSIWGCRRDQNPARSIMSSSAFFPASGHRRDGVDELGLELGADDYITKNLRELLARVRAGIKRKAEHTRTQGRGLR